MKVLLALTALGVATALGIALRSPPYRLDQVGQATDQQALAHRQSPYTSSTWIASPGANALELRFFDRLQGGVCLSPSWSDLAALARADARLAHLVPDAPPPAAAAQASWPYAWLPDPGTLPTTRYVNLFPLGVLLDDAVMAAAGSGPDAWRNARPDILVVGLGSGVGVAVLAHHFPHASITAVEIDPSVVEGVRSHYPLLRWLSARQTADGRPRLRFAVQDARQFLRSDARGGGRGFDLIVLDAYGYGSIIPPHLMTREFYAECRAALAEGGIVLSNIIGSYQPSRRGGGNHLVLGGAIRAMQEAGLAHVHDVPVMDGRTAFAADRSRNHIVLASASPLGPRDGAAAWQRAAAFVPYVELARGRPEWTTATLALMRGDRYVSAKVPVADLGAAGAGLRAALATYEERPFLRSFHSSDARVVAEARRLVRAAIGPRARAWDDADPGASVVWEVVDWLEHSRQIWSRSVQESSDARVHGGAALVGEPGDRHAAAIANAPLFSDARPNADILSRR